MTARGGAGRPLPLALAPTIGLGARGDRSRADPLRAYLERALDCPVVVEVEPSYASTIQALREGRIDVAMFGEAAALLGEQAGALDPLVAPVGPDGEVPLYQSVIFTRRDSSIYDLPSLRGRVVGLVDQQSASGYLMPCSMLREAGLDPSADVEVRLYGRHRLVAEAVIRGDVPAGATHASAITPPTPDVAPAYARLRVLATSRPIPRGPVVVRHDLPDSLRERLADAFLRIHQADPAAAAVLNVSGGQRFTTAAPRSVPTLKSIAALAGVSYATVSRAVNGSGPVAPETAARVAAIVEELGYRPNGHALTLQGQQAPLVGLLVPAHPDVDTLALADALRPTLADAGVPLVLCPVETDSVGATLYLDLLRDGRLGALVVTDRYARDADLAAVARTGQVVLAIETTASAPGMLNASLVDAAMVLLGAIGHAASIEQWRDGLVDATSRPFEVS